MKTWKCAYDGTTEKLKDGRCAACGRATPEEAKRDAKAWDKVYVHSSGPNGCRKNCRCCAQERQEQKIKNLVIAARMVYDDANDRGETHGDDGKEYPDWEELRLALEKFKEVQER